MIKELQIAIMARYNSDDGSTLRGLSQGMWDSVADSGAGLGTQNGQSLKQSVKPIIVFSIITSPLIKQSSCTDFFQPLVQFTVFSDGNNKAADIGLNVQNELLNLFGNEILTLSNGYTMTRNDTIEQRTFKDTEKIWNIITQMRFDIEKDR